MNRILIAFDGSQAAGKAFSVGMDLAEHYNAEVLVLAVARPPEFGGEVETEAVIENSKKHCESILRPLRTVADAGKRTVNFEIAVGHPDDQIVRRANEWQAELIVVGHRGNGVLGGLMIGSVAKHVMHHAKCSVLVAR